MQLGVDAATAELQNQPDQASARAEAEVAEAQKNAAVEAPKQAAHRALPISVFRQPQDAAPVRAPIVRTAVRQPGHDPRCRPTNRHPRL